MGETIFHKIIKREVPAEILFEDEHCIAIRDIQPISPLHVLIIPKKTLPSVKEMRADDKELLGHLFFTAKNLSEELGIADSGYRLVVNTGSDGGQTVDQLHVHLLGGRTFAWPAG